MDNDSSLTGQKPVLADTHDEPGLVNEAQVRHNVGAQPCIDATGDAKVLSESYASEKEQGMHDVQTGLHDENDASDDETLSDDLFVPFPPLKGVAPEASPLTVRAVLVGIILGSLCNASNVYLGTSRSTSADGPMRQLD